MIPHMRRAFTLLELLVATGVFVVGFVAVFSLFLAGMRFRKLADDTTRGALAASSLVHEIRIDSGTEDIGGAGTDAYEPGDYIGNGLAGTANPVAGSPYVVMADELYPYPQQPGTWFRVLDSTDVLGSREQADANAIDPTLDPVNQPHLSNTLHVKLLVLPFSTTDAKLSFTELQRRLRVRDDAGTVLNKDSTDSGETRAFIDTLVKRGLATYYDAVILRQPHWLFTP